MIADSTNMTIVFKMWNIMHAYVFSQSNIPFLYLFIYLLINKKSQQIYVFTNLDD